MTAFEPFRGGRRLLVWSLAACAVGAVLSIVGFAVNARQTFAAYLIAYFFVVTIELGLLAFVMGAHAMSATWPAAIRRLPEAALGAMPLVAVLYIPLLFAPKWLYPWAHPESVTDRATRTLLEHKLVWLNTPFVESRAVVYVAVWVLVAFLLRRESFAMDRAKDGEAAPDRRDRLRALSCALLPLVGITGTFAGFDWVMSLSPDFYSTMYGLYVLSGGFLGALGFLAVLVFAVERAGLLTGIQRSHWYALGRLLFAFLIFWAYIGFFQYLLIWIGNKPVEARFYIERIKPGDRWTSWFLVFGHFAAPWLVLLSYAVKRHRASVAALGAWLLVCHYIDVHWLVGADRGAPPWQWQDAGALLFIGGATVACAVWRQRGRLLAATHDPDWAAALAYESH
jgi:hypothetical protein